MRTRIPALALCLVAPLLRAQAPGAPLALKDILLLIRSGASEDRIGQMVKTRGVDFAFSDAAAAELSKAGAHQALFDQIRSASHPASAAAEEETEPRVLTQTAPVYPKIASQIAAGGKLSLRVLVGANGRPKDIEVQNPLGYGLDESAVAAVKQWTFEPARKNGQPVEGAVEVTLNFRIPQNTDREKSWWLPGAMAFLKPSAVAAPELIQGAALAGIPELENASIRFEFTVDAEGSVSSVRVLHAAPPTPASRDAAEKLAAAFSVWKFRPATRGGVPVEARGRVRFLKGYGDPDADKPLYAASELPGMDRPDFETPEFLKYLDGELGNNHERGVDFPEMSRIFEEWSLKTYGGKAELKPQFAGRQFEALAAMHPVEEGRTVVMRKDVKNRVKLDEDLGTFFSSRDLAPRATRKIAPKWKFDVDSHLRPEAMPYFNDAVRRLLADTEGRLLLENAMKKGVRFIVTAKNDARYAGVYQNSAAGRTITLFNGALGQIKPENEDENRFRMLSVMAHELVHAIYDKEADTMANEAIADVVSFRIVDRVPRFYGLQRPVGEAVDKAILGHPGLPPGGEVWKDLVRFGIDAPPPEEQFRDPPQGPPVLTSENEDSFSLGTQPGTRAKVDLLGKPAPSFTLDTGGGKRFRLEDLRGQVVVIDFWASWCGPCRSQMPAVAKLHAEAAKKGFTVIGVDGDSTPEAARKYLEENRYAWTNLHDAGNAVRGPFGVSAIPTTVVIDKEGVVRAYLVGASAAFAKDIRTALAASGIK
jgi:TonB family protein